MLIEEKSILARLMATENLYIEERNVPTASFSLKDRVLTVPILNGNLSSHVYDLFMGHEVGHALETPPDGWHDSVIDHGVNHSILNVCEDARIEKKIKRKFPGIRYSFIKAYQELMDMDFFGVKDKNINKMKLIDRINLHTKVGVSLNIQFNDFEQKLLNEVENTETFEEVVVVAKKIQQYMKEKKNSTKSKNVVPSKNGTENNSIDMDEFEFDEDKKFEVDENVSEQENQEKTENGIESKSESPKSEGSDSQESSDGEELKTEDETEAQNSEAEEGASSGSSEENLNAETHDAFRDNEKRLFGNERGDSLYCNIPDVNSNEFIIHYKDILSITRQYPEDFVPDIIEHYEQKKVEAFREFMKFKTSNEKVVSYLVKEFELRKNAEQQARVQISKSGDINMSRLSDYQFTDDIFRRISRIPNGKSHGLVMFIDWSGSMANQIHATIKQLLTLVYFCKKVNIPFDVYAFSSDFRNDGKLTRDQKFKHIYNQRKTNRTKFKTGDLYYQNGSLDLLNFFSSKMKISEINEMSVFLYNYMSGNNIFIPACFRLSGTPLNETVIAAFDIVPKFRSSNKLEIVNTIFLTDGDGHNLPGYVSGVGHSGPYISDYGHRKYNVSKLHLRDPKTKSSTEVIKYRDYTNSFVTVGLLQLLKQRAKCNVISFFVSSGGAIKGKIHQTLSTTLQKKLQFHESDAVYDQFRKNKFIIMKTNYYDEMYFIKSDNLDIDDDDEFEISETENTAKKLANAFTKYNEGKLQSRVFLNRFIRMIS